MRMFALAAAAASLLAGCAGADMGSRQLQGIQWEAVDVNGAPVTGGPLTFRLADGKASGHAGCNSWSANYDLEARGGIRLGPIASTEMACAPEIMEQEQRFLNVLRLAQGYSFYGAGGFSLIAGDGRAIRFRRP